MRVADDFPAIAQRLRQIEHERSRRALVLPPGVRIMIWESWEKSHLTADEVDAMEICLMLRQQLVVLVKSRSGGFTTRTGVDVLSLLKQRFPAAKQISDTQIILSSEEADQLRTLITHTPWSMVARP